MMFRSSRTSAAIAPLEMVACCELILIREVSGRGGEQGLWQVIADRGILCGADAQAVGPPWFDPDGLVVQIPDKRLMLLFKACQDPVLHFLAARCIQFPSELPMGAGSAV